MPIPVRCPSCEHAFRVPDQYAGKRGKCPKCKSVFVAEATDDTAAEFPVAASDAETALAGSGAKTVAVPKPKLLSKAASSSDAPPAGAAPVRRLKSAEPLTDVTPASAPPVVAAASPHSPAPTVAIATSNVSTSTGSSGAYAHRRTKKSNSLAVIAVGAIGLLVLLGIGGFVAWSLQNDPSLRADAQQNSDRDAADGVIAPPPVESGDDATAGDASPTSASLANWSTLEKSLVDIAVIDHTGGTRTGRGVIVDRRGWVATSYSLTEGATGAVATFANGDRVEFVGIRNEQPRNNLTLLQLDTGGSRAEFPALSIAGQWQPEAGERVFVAEGEQAQVTTVSGSATAQSIPAGSRARLPDAAREDGGLRLVVHSQRIEDGQDGMPLLLTNGHVAGICTALGLTRRGYAVPVSPLVEVLAAAESHKLVSFSEISPPTRPLQPQPPTEEVDDQPFARLQASVNLLAKFGWTPESPEHYEAFQLLAASLDAMQSIVDATAGDPSPQLQQRRERLEEMIESTVGEIAAAGMPDEIEQARVNQIALTAIAENVSLEQGVYLFGKCVMQPADFGERTVDGEPGFAFEIVGTERLVVLGVGIPENGRQIELGSRWLVLGMINPDERYRVPGDDKEPREAMVVRSKYLFGQ